MRTTPVTKEAGVWLDHRQAVVVTLLDKGEDIQRIESNVEKHVRYSGASHTQSPTGLDDKSEDGRDRRFNGHLNQYYDEVLALLQDVDALLIFGPGEAKIEFQKRLESRSTCSQFIIIEHTDKLTDNQIVAEVRQHFRG